MQVNWDQKVLKKEEQRPDLELGLCQRASNNDEKMMSSQKL